MATSVATPQIYYSASLGAKGNVVKGQPLTKEKAIAERKKGRDVVACGPTLATNRQHANLIEHQATGGKCVYHPPHANAGVNALPHFQPQPRGLSGHTFYEDPPLRTAK